ncbi:hypothetical protein NGB36_20685 [Streptomyces sp. RB6PN25]|uniref:Uncharacterized protein n=1 Tax=Streptomyces humicola TaxID=2953240 RepID=A0ABT1PZ59_9ACTN|nr:hypothetical protein [Streptomyces humicola]MCQ4082951.1 hypothetical protein [Streptomyces humicola]
MTQTTITMFRLHPSADSGFALTLIARDDTESCFYRYDLHIDERMAGYLKAAVLRELGTVPLPGPVTLPELLQLHADWTADLCRRQATHR